MSPRQAAAPRTLFVVSTSGEATRLRRMFDADGSRDCVVTWLGAVPSVRVDRIVFTGRHMAIMGEAEARRCWDWFISTVRVRLAPDGVEIDL